MGAEACARCHAQETHTWAGSRHSHMVQPATIASVQGDFRGQVTLRGSVYTLRQRDGKFFITESYLTGQPVEHRVEYTLGNRRIQHYLTTLADGRIVLLPPSWDILRKKWFHNLDVADPEETPGVLVQVWNKGCYSCHVSQEKKNFDAASLTYKTTWLNFGTNCERCHGPGSDHVAHYSAAVKPQGPVRDIVLQTRLDAARNTQVCAQCHSFRDIFAEGYTAGADYYNYFLPVMEYRLDDPADPAYWPDGRTRRFSNDAIGLWQSECYLKGKVTCVDCHVQAHQTEIERNPQLRPDTNALCTRCHQAIGAAPAKHTHHAETSAGSSCVECHMPRTVYSIKAEIRDHSMSIPAPENTIRHGIPNACNVCHKDRDAKWTLARMNEWWPGSSLRQKWIRRADAFAGARAGDAKVVPQLLAILAEQAEGPLARANAAGHLSRFANDAAVAAALVGAAHDPEPLVRSVAVLGLGPLVPDRVAAVGTLATALGDSSTIVRVSALASLANLGVRSLPGEDGEKMAQARAVFDARAALNDDDSGQQVAAGTLYLLFGDAPHAETALNAALRLDPAAQAQYLLAAAYVEQKQYAKARTELQTIPQGDPQYEKAQRLLKAIAAAGY